MGTITGYYYTMTGRTRGLGSGMILKTKRKLNCWTDNSYKFIHFSLLRDSLLLKKSHARGLIIEKIGIESKQPNSAIRKAVRIQLSRCGKKVSVFIPHDGSLNSIDENDEVLISGLGRSTKSIGDVPGVRFKIVKVFGVSLLSLYRFNLLNFFL